jgi:hypothetical protein
MTMMELDANDGGDDDDNDDNDDKVTKSMSRCQGNDVMESKSRIRVVLCGG